MTPADYLRAAADAAWLSDVQARDLRDLADDLEEAVGPAASSMLLQVNALLLQAALASDPHHPAWDAVFGWQRLVEAL